MQYREPVIIIFVISVVSGGISHLAHALITSRLEYRSALLYGLPGTLMTRLQRVQNSAARLMTHTGKQRHITRVLQCALASSHTQVEVTDPGTCV